MSLFFYKITPVSVICILGIIYLFIQFFISGRDYNIFAYLIIFIIFLTVAFAADRFLVSKVAYRKLVIFEFIFLVVCTIWYMYSSRYTMINIETSKPYFFIVYDNGGLKKADIPSTGLFKKSITITSDSNIHIQKSLEYDAQVNPPVSWNYNYSSNKAEANANGEHIIVQIIANDMGEKELKEKLDEEVKRIQQ